MHPTTRVLLLAALALGLSAVGPAQGSDTDKVNGSVTIAAGQTTSSASTVNGSIHVEANARVGKASTVNGSINLGEHATATKVDTVNGALLFAAGSRVTGEASTVNGRMELGPGASVDGRLYNVNGAITLDRAHVGGGIGTVNGDITIGADSRVEGGIVVERSTSWFPWFGSDPVIVIGPHAVVQGTLDFRRTVVLKVSDSAQIGKVVGATAVKFSGAKP